MTVFAYIAVLLVILLTGSALYKGRRTHGKLTSIKLVPSIKTQNKPEIESLQLTIESLMNEHDRRRFHFRPLVVLEIISSGKEGILFLISAPPDLLAPLSSQLEANFPSLQVVKVKNSRGYRLPARSLWNASEWKPASIEAEVSGLPLKHLLGGLNTLNVNETAGWQVVLSQNSRSAADSAFKLVRLCFKFLFRLVLDIASGAEQHQARLNRLVMAGGGGSEAPPSLSASVRTLVGARSIKRLKQLELSLNAAVASCGFKRKFAFKRDVVKGFIDRRPGNSFPLGIKALAQLYALPDAGVIPKEKMVTQPSRLLKVPLSLLKRDKAEVLLGVNKLGNERVMLGLSSEERSKHLLVLGGTGMGKSTMLGYSFLQDMVDGKGCALIDPHGDLANMMLGYVPAKRLGDVIFIDPTDLDYPVALNLLELPSGLSANELEIAKDRITEAVVSIFRKIFSDDNSGGHRIEYILRNTIQTAFYVKNANLFTLRRLLSDDLFRVGVLSGINDDSLKSFWHSEYAKAGSFQKVKMISGVTAKLGRFERSAVVRRMLEPAKSTLDFDEVINSGKILVCNLAKGSIGEDTSALLGMVMIAKLQLAVWKRALTSPEKRKAFYLYVDEFQEFASPSFSQLVSESRKYKLALTLAEQTMAHQNESENNILLANIGNIVCFRTASKIDNQNLKALLAPDITSRDISNLPQHHFYFRSAEAERPKLVSGMTITIKGEMNERVSESAKSASRKNYTYPYKVARKENKAKVPMKSGGNLA